MTVFACAGCGAVLTVPLSRVVLPVHAHGRYGHDLLGVLMEPGTYAVDPDRLPEVRRPWLRAIYDHFTDRRFAPPF
ncbi:hypothetical protein [Nonomuraea sediminis]|uniref:hypothetical protein n=1 Tax=Nonomuraea sediminis TaxID=2835864 RepID=UPI001BDC82DB|nr:hypothetical protein [Nonomuraea sediminis]